MGDALDKLKGIKIFEGKSLEDVFQDIYERSTEDRNAAMSTFLEFKEMIKDQEDLFMLGDKPDKYLKIAQESTDNLIKMVNAVQKVVEKGVEDNEDVDPKTLLAILDDKGVAPTRFRREETIEDEKPIDYDDEEAIEKATIDFEKKFKKASES
jgi:hypothetical protein